MVFYLVRHLDDVGHPWDLVVLLSCHAYHTIIVLTLTIAKLLRRYLSLAREGFPDAVGGYCNSGVRNLTGSSRYTGSPACLSSNARGLSSRVGNMSRYRTRRTNGKWSGVFENDRTVRGEGDGERGARGESSGEFSLIRIVLIANGSCSWNSLTSSGACKFWAGSQESC